MYVTDDCLYSRLIGMNIEKHTLYFVQLFKILNCVDFISIERVKTYLSFSFLQ